MKKFVLFLFVNMCFFLSCLKAGNFDFCISVTPSINGGSISITLKNNTAFPINVAAVDVVVTPSNNAVTITGGTTLVNLVGSSIASGSSITVITGNYTYPSGTTGMSNFTMSNPNLEVKIVDGSSSLPVYTSGTVVCSANNIPLTLSLPVELISFQAQTQNKTAKLEWLTASEKNSSHFEIERSSDGKVFNKIGIVKANGNTYSKQDYELIDEKPFQGINYYRLKMVDLDATYEYSKIVSVWMDKKGKDKIFTISPNPARGNVNFNIFNGEESEAVLDVRDIAGREIYHKKLLKENNIQNIDWNTEGVSKGVYFVTLTADGERITKKLIIN